MTVFVFAHFHGFGIQPNQRKARFLELAKKGKGHLKTIPASNQGEEAIAGTRKDRHRKWVG